MARCGTCNKKLEIALAVFPAEKNFARWMGNEEIPYSEKNFYSPGPEDDPLNTLCLKNVDMDNKMAYKEKI